MGTKLKFCAVLFFVFLIGQVCHAHVKTFRCHDGEYIKDYLFCDGYRSCRHREDEGSGYGENSSCKRDLCGQGKFACDGDQCHNITVRCNTLKDCQDDTDELDCGDEINVKDCTGKGKFLCSDGLRCLDLDMTCNKDCNCFDCSDENKNCTKHDPDLLLRCPNVYFVGGNGPVCLCDSSTDSQTRRLCKGIKVCPSYYGCDQYCIWYKSKKFCSCYEGFHPADGSDGSKCKINDMYGNALIYSTMAEIKMLNVTTNISTMIQSGVHMCTALSATHDYVYYAAVALDGKAQVLKAPIISGAADVVTESDFNITSIAPDYITGNIYFTSNGSLSVCSNDGRVCRQLKCCNVIYVVAAPKSGWLFYLQTNGQHGRREAVVMRSNMDGSNETIFADVVNYGVKFSLVIDEYKSRLYSNALVTNSYDKATIVLIALDNEFKTTDTVPNLNTLSVLNGDLFITVNDMSGILHTSEFHRLETISNDRNLYFRDSTTSSIKYLYAYNAVLQKKNKNPCAAASCPGLCLLRPTSETNSTLTYTCHRKNASQFDNTHSYANQTTTPKQHTQNRDNFTLKQESYSSTETTGPKQDTPNHDDLANQQEWDWSTEHYKYEEFPQSAKPWQNHNILAIVIVPLLLILVIGLGFGGYFMLKKWNWHRYYLHDDLRSWRWNRKTDKVKMVRDEGMVVE